MPCIGNTDDNLYQIPYLQGNDTFLDWVCHYNTLGLNKLNNIQLYRGVSGDGIVFTLGTTAGNDPVGGETSGPDLPAGTFRVSIADVIPKGITFSEDVSINGTLNYDFSKSNFDSIKVRLFPEEGFTGSLHGFSFGHAIRVDKTYGCTGDATYYLGRADDKEYAEVFGVVSGFTWPSESGIPQPPYNSNNTYIEVTTHGKIKGDFTKANDHDAGLSAGTVYFLSPGISGGFTPIEPIIAGHISKPLIMGITADEGIVLNYRGQFLTGTGGTGATAGQDSNNFIIQTTNSDLIRGVVAGYDGNSWIKVSSNTNSVSNSVGIVTHRYTLDGTDYIKIVTSGFVDDFPINDGSSGLLYVNSNGQLTSSAVGGFQKPFAIAWASAGGSSRSGVVINQNHAGGGAGSGSNFGNLNSSPVGGGNAWAYRSSTSGGATYGSAINENILINGSFDVWQRGIGKTKSYGATGTTYFADRWVRLDGISGGGSTPTTYSLQRNEFTKNQTEVAGNPKYYLSAQHTISDGGAGNSGDFVVIENRIEDVRTARGEDVTLSFAAKCGVTGSTMGIVVNQYDGSDVYRKDVANVSLGSVWGKYEISFNVPTINTLPIGSKHYISVGFDVTKLSATTLDLTKVKVERGLVATTNPKSDVENELEKCNRYYQRSYNIDQKNASETMLDLNNPTPTVIDFTITPLKDLYFRYPVRMRGIPSSVAFYSPKTGTTGDAYNRSAEVDLRKASGTFGYDGTARISVAGATTIKAEHITEDGMYIIVPSGSVLWDQISTHYVADAELDENMTNS